MGLGASTGVQSVLMPMMRFFTSFSSPKRSMVLL